MEGVGGKIERRETERDGGRLCNFWTRPCTLLSVIYNGFLAGNGKVSIDHEPYFRRI